MPSIEIPMWINVLQNVKKNYNYNRIHLKQFNSIYKGDINWIAHWFYTQIDPYADNVTFDILGDFHATYMQPEHLSIRVIYPDGQILPNMHIQYNPITGEGELQTIGMPEGQGINKKNYKSKRKNKLRKKYKSKKNHKLNKKYKSRRK